MRWSGGASGAPEAPAKEAEVRNKNCFKKKTARLFPDVLENIIPQFLKAQENLSTRRTKKTTPRQVRLCQNVEKQPRLV